MKANYLNSGSKVDLQISAAGGEMKPFSFLILFLRGKVDSLHFEVMDTR